MKVFGATWCRGGSVKGSTAGVVVVVFLLEETCSPFSCVRLRFFSIVIFVCGVCEESLKERFVVLIEKSILGDE